ncbi:hypothetical protein EMIT0P44_210073 [Pseudomonas sp. IT-P44]
MMVFERAYSRASLAPTGLGRAQYCGYPDPVGARLAREGFRKIATFPETTSITRLLRTFAQNAVSRRPPR